MASPMITFALDRQQPMPTTYLAVTSLRIASFNRCRPCRACREEESTAGAARLFRQCRASRKKRSQCTFPCTSQPRRPSQRPRSSSRCHSQSTGWCPSPFRSLSQHPSQHQRQCPQQRCPQPLYLPAAPHPEDLPPKAASRATASRAPAPPSTSF